MISASGFDPPGQCARRDAGNDHSNGDCRQQVDAIERPLRWCSLPRLRAGASERAEIQRTLPGVQQYDLWVMTSLRGESVPVGRVRGILHVPKFLRGYIAEDAPVEIRVAIVAR